MYSVNGPASVSGHLTLTSLAGGHLRETFSLAARGPFLERPVNFSRPKANFKIKTQLNSSIVPTPQTSHFASLTDSFIVIFSKLLKL